MVKKNGKALLIVGILIIIIILILFFVWYFVSRGRNTESPREKLIQGCMEELEKKGYEIASIGAAAKGDILVCNFEAQENQQNCRDEYYFYTTLIKNTNYCNNIEYDQFKKICLMLYESDNRCSELQDESKIMCDSAFGGPKEACESIANEDARLLCRNIYSLVKAIKEKDISKCNDIVDDSYKGICSTLLGKGLSEEEKNAYCSKAIESGS